jgi:hypothetical protein
VFDPQGGWQQNPFQNRDLRGLVKAVGEGELVARQGGQRVAMARRNGHAPLAIERQRRGPLKDELSHFSPPNPTELHFIAEIDGFTEIALEKSIKSTT